MSNVIELIQLLGNLIMHIADAVHQIFNPRDVWSSIDRMEHPDD